MITFSNLYGSTFDGLLSRLGANLHLLVVCGANRVCC